MSRYSTVRDAGHNADSFWDDRLVQPLGHPQVVVLDPVRTGLVDQYGNPIYRLPDAVGFLPKRK